MALGSSSSLFGRSGKSRIEHILVRDGLFSFLEEPKFGHVFEQVALKRHCFVVFCEDEGVTD